MNVKSIITPFHLIILFGVLLADSAVYSLFAGERGLVRSGVGLARLVLERERENFVVLSGLGRAGDRFCSDGEECVNVGLGERGAVSVGVWSVSLTTHLTGDPPSTRTYATHPDTLCLCRLIPFQKKRKNHI